MEKKLQEKVDAALERADDRPVMLMFQDEARFGRISDPRRCWAPYPLRPVVQAAIVREFIYAYAAVSPKDGVLESLVLPSVNTPCMSVFLEEVAARHPEHFIVMIFDGAGWHRSTQLKVPENMTLLSLPPYSPELNPVESLWEEVREKGFHNLVFKNLDAVEDRLVTQLRELELNPTLVKSITGWDWIISISLNTT